MSNSPDEQPSDSKKRRRRIWSTTGLTLMGLVLLGAAGGALWVWVFVNERLSPWLSEQLSESLNRPVTLGEVERVSLNRVQFGPSAISPTEDDPDELYVESIQVGFNPLLLLRRRFRPRITLVGVRASVEQAESGQWIETELDLPERDPDQDPFIQVDPTIGIEAGEVSLLPYQDDAASAVPLIIGEINGRIAIAQVEVVDPRDSETLLAAQAIDLNLTAVPDGAGQVSVRGEVRSLDYGEDPPKSPLGERLAANLAVQTQQLDLARLAPVLLATLPQDLPLSVQSGIFNSALEITLTPGDRPQVTGTARLEAGAIALAALPQGITNIEGQARFQGYRVALENVTADYGNLTARAGGLIDSRTGYDLSGEVAPFELADLVETLALDLPVDVAGEFRAEATVTGSLSTPQVTGQLLSTQVTALDRVQFARIATELIYTPGALQLANLTLEPLAGGRLTGSGQYTLGDPATLSLQIEGQDLPADAIGRAYGLPDTVTLGAVAVDAEITGPLSALVGQVSWEAPDGTYPTRGTAEIAGNTLRIQQAELAGGTLSGTGTLSDGQWAAAITAQGLQLGAFRPALAGTRLDGDVELTGQLGNLTLRGIQGSGNVTAALGGGTLNSQVTLANGTWTADVQTRNFPAGQFFPQLPVAGVSADARLSGQVDALSLTAIQGDGTVTAAIAGGTVTSTVVLDRGFWQAQGQGSGLQLGQLAPQLRGRGSGAFQLTGSLETLTPAGIQGRAQLVLSDGLATAARLAPALARMPDPLTTTLAWDGRTLQVERLETAGLSASGTVTPRLSGPGAPGIAAVDLALSARDYALSSLPIAFPPALGLTGAATFDGRLTGTPETLTLAGTLSVADLALNDLEFESRLAGPVDFSSQQGLAIALTSASEDQITVNYQGDPRQLSFRVQAGDAVAIGTTEGERLRASVYNFPVSTLNIPPAEMAPYGTLRGQVTFATATINLRTGATTGQADIANLGMGYLNVDRLFGGFAYADGVFSLANGQVRMVDRNARGEAIATRSYDIAARYAFNQTPQIQARLATEAGELRDILEVLQLRELADLRRGFTPTDGLIPESQAEAQRILATTPAGNVNATLLDQLRRLSELLEIEVQEARQVETATLPPLSELQGAFRGQVNLLATVPDDITVTFDIAGQDWQWGSELSANSVLARGRYDNGLISLTPLQLSQIQGQDTASVELTGGFSLDPTEQVTQQLQLRVADVPASSLQEVANLPFDLGGVINGTATLRGRPADPELVGTFELTAGTLNREPLERAEARIRYENARFDLTANLLLMGIDDPLTLSAQGPYSLPFIDNTPTDRSFALTANVQDEGFALLNLFTNQVSWDGGDGEAILEIAGDLDQGGLTAPSRFNGLILFQGATLSFSALPTPMTDVTGRIQLDPEGILVERLTGQFSEGELTARGTFPLYFPLSSGASEADTAAPEETPQTSPAEPPPDDTQAPPAPRLRETPLTLNMQNIALDLKALYEGQVNGQVVLGGSLLLGPELMGDIELSQGVITIPENGGVASPTAVSTADRDSLLPPLRFNDLQLELDRNIRILRGDLLDVAAQGSLRLRGTLDTLQPFGTIQLTSGRVGLFAASLRLAGDNDRADFRGSFDPLLDVTLQTSLPDTSASGIEPTTSPFPRNEVPDTTLENLGLTQQGNRLVRISARYSGRASELGNITTDARNLELSSSPIRTQQEIIALLSGNVIGAFNALEGDGSQALGSFATFAGSALLGTLRDFLGDTVPLSEFRLFQVAESSGQVNESQDIGLEVGFDVRSNISVSILKVLTNDTPFQFNARYRISDQFSVRGTTSYEDFQDRTGVLLEYETRF